jgi:hypothetical protein
MSSGQLDRMAFPRTSASQRPTFTVLLISLRRGHIPMDRTRLCSEMQRHLFECAKNCAFSAYFCWAHHLAILSCMDYESLAPLSLRRRFYQHPP